MNYYKRCDCRYCSSTNLEKIISLGHQPPSNSFINKEDFSEEESYPLELYFCKDCSLVQLLDIVSGSDIFDDYHYRSSSSRALVEHLSHMVESLTKRFDIKSGDTVVDIGCNDGVTLKAYNIEGLKCVGVEPSKVSEVAEGLGFNVVKSFFNKETSKHIVENFGSARIVTATNVFAHADNMHEFIKGIPSLLSDDGVFVVEVSYIVDLIDNNLFDTIYHEHLCYIGLTPLVKFIKQYDMHVFDIDRLSLGASGPAIRVYIQKNNGANTISNNVSKILSDEIDWGVNNVKKYKEFEERVQIVKKDTINLLKKLKSEGCKIGGFGAPAKGNTMLNFYGINSKIIDCIADNTTIKQGRYTPGSHIKIIDDDSFNKLNYDYALLLSWNYLDYFLANSDYINNGGQFIVPLPFPKIAPVRS